MGKQSSLQVRMHVRECLYSTCWIVHRCILYTYVCTVGVWVCGCVIVCLFAFTVLCSSECIHGYRQALGGTEL